MSKLKKTAMNLSSECNLVTSNDYLIAAYTYDANKSIISKTPVSANIIAVNSQKLYISGYWTSSGLSWKEFNSNNGLEILTSTSSQTSKVVSGVVKNSSGVGISGATVQILNSSNGVLATVTTTTGGIFNANLSSTANPTKLTVSASGYTTQTVSISSLVGNSIIMQVASTSVNFNIYVKSSSNGSNIYGASVKVYNASNGLLASGNTNSQGLYNVNFSYTSNNTPYKVVISMSGYTDVVKYWSELNISGNNTIYMTATAVPITTCYISGKVMYSGDNGDYPLDSTPIYIDGVQVVTTGSEGEFSFTMDEDIMNNESAILAIGSRGTLNLYDYYNEWSVDGSEATLYMGTISVGDSGINPRMLSLR